MPQINHFRRFVQRQPKTEKTPFDVNSFLGAVDPEWDDLAKTEETIVERLRDRGSF